MEDKVDNSYDDNRTYVPFNSLFNSLSIIKNRQSKWKTL